MGKAIVPVPHKGARRQLQHRQAWDEAMERKFLAKLAVTANVRLSLEAVGKSAASLYTRRRTRPAFKQAWNEALSEGYALLEAEMLNESLNGVAQIVVADGIETTVYRRTSDATKLSLLKQHGATVAAHRAAQSVAHDDTARLRQLVERRLDRLEASLRRKGMPATGGPVTGGPVTGGAVTGGAMPV